MIYFRLPLPRRGSPQATMNASHQTVQSLATPGPGSSSVGEFRAFLEGRTKVPPQRVDEFLEWDDQVLQEAMGEVEGVLRRFAEAVADAASAPAGTRDFLRALDLKLISQDHNWRAIFATVRAQSIWSDEHRELAIKNYLEYLGFRRRLLAFIQEKRASLSETRAWYFTLTPTGAPGEEGASRGAAAAPEGFYRLPNGAPVELALPASRVLYVWLAGSRFQLVGSQPAQVITDQGESLPCFRDRNLVGRHVSSDVVVPERYVSVSRAHLLVEWHKGGRVVLTDLSTYGTFIESRDEHLVQA